ncbi:MAG: NFACT RNA binding domain-containing protein [Desulfovibrionaceae bacterium]|nr:NFACT RNA binding domain-containing protein [Desulfovibrionaceae bacterium]
MDAHLFRRFCDALLPLLEGARLEKIQEPAPAFLVLTFYGAGRKFQLCLRHGRKDGFCFVSTARITAGQAPTAPVMRLRKYLADRRVMACVAQCWQRRLWLLMGSGPVSATEGGVAKACWLLLDLRDGPSLHFLSPDESPEEERQRWPEAAELPQALADWRQWPVLTPALRRCLVHLEAPECSALLEDLRLGGGDVFCQSLPETPERIQSVSAWPLPAPLRAAMLETGGDDVLALLERAGQSLVLERLAQSRLQAAAHPLTRRMARLERRKRTLDEEEARLAGMRARQADALALQENLWRWPVDMRAPNLTVEEGAHGPAREIRLDARYSVRQNMERLFHTARRGLRGQEHLARRRAELEAEMAALARQRQECLAGLGSGMTPGPGGRQEDAPLPRYDLPKNVQLFISDDGFALLRGRDAKGNLAVRKLAAPHDIWLHAENGPGSHLVIRRAHAGQEVPERTLDQAGGLAACKSWQRDAAYARIIYAEMRHVKPMRNAPTGTVRMDKIWASREVAVDHSLEARLAADAHTGEGTVRSG